VCIVEGQKVNNNELVVSPARHPYAATLLWMMSPHAISICRIARWRVAGQLRGRVVGRRKVG